MLDDTTLTAKAEYSLLPNKGRKDNGSNSYIFVNATKIYQFKAKDSDITTNLLCLVKTSKYFSVDNMKKIVLNGYVFDFSVDYPNADVGAVQGFHFNE